MRLFEQYRPQRWDDVIGQDKARGIIDALRPRGLAGRAYWISGPSGTGKTTIAYLVAREVADPIATQELDGTQVTAGWLGELESYWRMTCLGAERNGRAIIINEAHGINGRAVKRLLSLLEDANLPRHVAVLFTTTTDGLTLFADQQVDAHPLLSRCTCLKLTSQGLAPKAAPRLQAIAEELGLNGKPVKAYERLIHESKGNLRAALQRIEEGAMTT